MIVISSSYGNDSMALIRWAHENSLDGVFVVYIDTGWATHEWIERVELGEKLAKSYGFKVVRIVPAVQFEELIKTKKGFPNQRYQWCSGALKGVPFLNWIDEVDPDREAKVLIGKRRSESRARAETPEFIEKSEYHGDRTVWHPLYKHSDQDRDDLLVQAGIEVLPHRSRECHPCVNANKGDLVSLTVEDIEKVKNLEAAVDKTMFRPKRHKGAEGIIEVVEWASRNNYIKDQEDLFDAGCGSPFGCGL